MEQKKKPLIPNDGAESANDVTPRLNSLLPTSYPSWTTIGAMLGGIAAFIAILQFFGISTVTSLFYNFKSADVSGRFISFRDTDLQIALDNGARSPQFISDALLLLKSSDEPTEVRMSTCCGVNSNVLPPQQNSTLFLRSRAANSNFGFYHDVLLPFEGFPVSGSIMLTISKGQEESYPLEMEIPEAQLVAWINEKIIALHNMCESLNDTKPEWCM